MFVFIKLCIISKSFHGIKKRTSLSVRGIQTETTLACLLALASEVIGERAADKAKLNAERLSKSPSSVNESKP